VTDKTSAPAGVKRQSPSSAVVFELEWVALRARQLEYAAVKQVFGNKGHELNPGLYVRYGTHREVREAVPALLKALGKDRAASEKLVVEAQEAVAAVYKAPGLKLQAAVARLLKAAADAGRALGAVSVLEREKAQDLASRLGLSALGVSLVSCNAGRQAEPGADAWMRCAHSLRLVPSQCVALATSAIACKGAVKANMRCVAIPDVFTTYEDFSGVDLLLESVDELDFSHLPSVLGRLR
jgi:beta-phosphoglucomutase-like phosphatase (HAD superfamily)